jgi:hypothetical protein
MIEGKCHLCGANSGLVQSHVLPKFSYKKFVSDQSTGGSFIDVQRGQIHNRQFTTPLLCQRCDNELVAGLESYASRFCERILHGPQEPHAYDETLLRFAASISWRVVRCCVPASQTKAARDLLKKPSRRWKEYLLEQRPDVRPFSQHIFVLVGGEVDWHKGLRGEVLAEDELVLSQVGPLYMVGLLERRNLSAKDRRIWSESELRPGGGTITPISEWRVGENVTGRFAQVLKQRELWMIERVFRMGPPEGQPR